MGYARKVKKHFWMRYRNEGASERLHDRVHILTVFVEDAESHWDEASKHKFWRSLEQVIPYLCAEAKRYGTELEVKHSHFVMEIPADYTAHWFTYLPRFFPGRTILELQQHYEKKLGCDEAPFLFVFNQKGRCYACADKDGDGYESEEFSVIFRDFKPFAIMHELLHQFGARDYYFPAWVKEIAQKYYPESIMLGGGMEVDDLTAFLVGWQPEISETSYHFLKDTMRLNEKVMEEARKAEWAKTKGQKF
ncbi:MAG: hypothetical protein IJW99_07595 [Clostridia bacterium]|nr:hypothetical protein [Clostridia bacterium]